MSATVTYKGNTLTTAENQTRTLLTAGKYLEDNITITDVTSGGGGGGIIVGDPTHEIGLVLYKGQTQTITGLPEFDPGLYVAFISDYYNGFGWYEGYSISASSPYLFEASNYDGTPIEAEIEIAFEGDEVNLTLSSEGDAEAVILFVPTT